MYNKIIKIIKKYCEVSNNTEINYMKLNIIQYK